MNRLILLLLVTQSELTSLYSKENSTVKVAQNIEKKVRNTKLKMFIVSYLAGCETIFNAV